MEARDQKIFEEASALWRQLYSEPPPCEADGPALLDMIMCRLPDTSYGRLISAHMRSNNVVFPKPEES